MGTRARVREAANQPAGNLIRDLEELQRPRKVSEAFACSRMPVLAVLDDERGFVIDAMFLANVPEVLVLFYSVSKIALQISFAPRSL